MKKKRKLLSLLVAFLFMFTLIPSSVYAEGSETETKAEDAQVQEVTEETKSDVPEEVKTEDKTEGTEDLQDEKTNAETQTLQTNETKAAAVNDVQPKAADNYAYEKVSTIDSTEAQYVIAYDNKVALNNAGNSYNNDTSIDVIQISGNYYNITNITNKELWTFSKTVASETSDVKLTNAAGNQLKVNRSYISMGSEGDDLVVSSGENFTIRYVYPKGDSNYGKENYLIYDNFRFKGNRQNIGSAPNNAQMSIYKKVQNEERKVTINFSVANNEVTVDPITYTYYAVPGTTYNYTFAKPKELVGFNCDKYEVTENGETKTFDNESYTLALTSNNATVTYYYSKLGEDDIELTKTAERDETAGIGTYDITLGVKGGEPNNKVDVVLVADRSNSMCKQTYNGETLAKITKDAMDAFIEGVMPEEGTSNVRIAVVGYNNGAQCFTGSGTSHFVDTMKAAKQGAADAEWESTDSNDGGTNTKLGFEKALEVLNDRTDTEKSQNKALVVFMTDGIPTAPESNGRDFSANNFNYAVAAGKELAEISDVYTVGLLLAYQSKSAEEKIADYLLSSTSSYKCTKIDNKEDDYDVNYKSNWYSFDTDGNAYSKEYFGVKSGENASKKMEKIYKNIANKAKALATGNVTDVLPKEFKLADGEKARLEGLHYTIKENYPSEGETTIISPDIPAGKDVSSITFKVTEKSPSYGAAFTNEGNATYDYKLYDGTVGTQSPKSFDSIPVGLINPEAKDDVYYAAVNQELKINDTTNNIKANDSDKLPSDCTNYTIGDLKVQLVDNDGKILTTEAAVKEVYPFIANCTISEDPNLGFVVSDITFKSDAEGKYEFKYKDTAWADKKDNSNDKGENKDEVLVSNIATVTINVIGVKNQAYVLDYGKPVSYEYDKVFDSDIEKDKDTTINLQNGNGTYGRMEVTTKNSTKYVKYTLTDFMDGIDEFKFNVNHTFTNSDNTATKMSLEKSVTMIPATSVYYEDNFGSDGGGIQYDGGWTILDNDGNVVSAPTAAGEQNSDGPYGYDSSYSGDSKYSGGYTHCIEGKTATGNVSASFTFKGTGFDVISRTVAHTDKDWGSVWMTVVNTTTNVKVINTTKITSYESNGETGLYQIPVLNAYDLPYGEYTVTLSIAKGQTFYLDGIRIYNPLGTVTDGTVAGEAYKAAKELSPSVVEIRNILIANENFGKDEDTKGAVYIDEEGTIDSGKIADYVKDGPKNEVYLAEGQAIGFKITNYSDFASIQIGLKSPDGTASRPQVNGSNLIKDNDDGNLNTATDMNYDITQSVINNEGIVVIKNAEDGGLLAITNLKAVTNTGVVIEADVVSNDIVLGAIRRFAYAAVPDEEPVISGTDDLTIKAGDDFDAMADVTALDKEDGDLTSKIVVDGTVDSEKEGVYTLTYSVEDSNGNKVEATRTVTVRSNEKPVISGADDVTVKYKAAFDLMAGVTATDKEDGDLTSKIVVNGTVNTKKAGKYTITYKVADSDGNTTEVSRVVTVKKSSLWDIIGGWF